MTNARVEHVKIMQWVEVMPIVNNGYQDAYGMEEMVVLKKSLPVLMLILIELFLLPIWE